MDSRDGGPQESSPIPIITSSTTLPAHSTEIEAEILQLRLEASSIDHLAVASTDSEAAALESIVSPILILPSEITAEVFVHYVGPLVDFHDSQCGPLLLASICRAWRAIAVNLQPLWSSIEIHPMSTLWGTENLLQHWLPRAGDHPLDLDIRKQHRAYNVLGLLAPSSMQWRSLQLVLTPPFWVINEIQGRVPLLKKLTVILDLGTAMDDALPLITAFSDAPQLRAASLFRIPPRRILLPWTQLTWLEWFGSNSVACIQILRQTPHLETLSVELSEDISSDLPAVMISLEHLHTFTLYGRQKLRLLDHVVAPALKHFTLAKFSDQAVVPRLLALLARSECTLSSISIASSLPPAAISALEAVPTVSEIQMPLTDWPPADFAALFTRISSDASFLPNMRSFVLEECYTRLPYAEAAAMLAARWHGHGNDSEYARLAHFRFVRHPTMNWVDPEPAELDPAVSHSLQALKADGLKIEIPGLTNDHD
ncbi:hypothetical protein FB451DRAFT_286501 [Mycena latifolia]|nr:hypothetical protein FB451DRAFT_286501 [Mycena latifolia]